MVPSKGLGPDWWSHWQLLMTEKVWGQNATETLRGVADFCEEPSGRFKCAALTLRGSM